MNEYFVYILTNWNNKILYVGVTNNLIRRIYEHKTKMVEGFSKKYNLTKLVYFEMFQQIDDAIAAEKKMKGWLRSRKLKLIEENNPNWKDLADELDSSLRSE